MISKMMVRISLIKKNGILGKLNMKVEKQFEKPNSYNPMTKMLQVFIKRIPEKG